MTEFHYRARDETEKIREGVIDAESRVEAADLLQGKGLKIIRLAEQIGTARAFTFAADSRYWSVFCRQLSVLTETQSTYDALSFMAAQEENRLLSDLCQAVAGGRSLSEAMMMYGGKIPLCVTHLIKVGERSGRLPEVLGRLADYLDRETAARQKFRAAMLYPTLLAAATFLALAIMLTFILPGFAELFNDLSAPLPLSTQILLGFGQFAVEYALVFPTVLLILLIMWRVLIRRERFAREIDRLKLKIPIFGALQQDVAWLHILSALTVMQRSGLRLAESLYLVSDMSENRYLTWSLNEARQKMEHGSTLKAALSDCLPVPLVLGLIAAGEQAGCLEEMLAKSADYVAMSAESRLSRVEALAEPVMILIVGAFVIVIAISIVLPILDVIDSAM